MTPGAAAVVTLLLANRSLPVFRRLRASSALTDGVVASAAIVQLLIAHGRHQSEFAGSQIHNLGREMILARRSGIASVRFAAPYSADPSSSSGH
jgi:hypothetical protein